MPYVKDLRVDAYLDRLPAWQREIGHRVRDLVHEADPEVVETIKRTVQPYFVLDPEGIITGGHGNKTGRAIAYRENEQINERALLAMFRQIIANNRAGGWRKLKASRPGT